MRAINKAVPLKEYRIKSQNQEWFDGEVFEAMVSRDKLLKKFKKKRSKENELLYKESKYFVENLIINKKKSFFENKLKESIGKPKELWKNLKAIGLPKKVTYLLTVHFNVLGSPSTRVGLHHTMLSLG